MAKKRALLPCPFCGGKAERHGKRKDPVVDCVDCEASAISVDAWNTRTPAHYTVVVKYPGAPDHVRITRGVV